MNAKLFDGISKLSHVGLLTNFCIDGSYGGTISGNSEEDEDFKELSSLPIDVDAHCSFIETKFTDCGTVSYSTGQIVEGTVVKKGEWPFMAALVEPEQRKFFCGGNLITKNHVLTGKRFVLCMKLSLSIDPPAAHCLQEKYKNWRKGPDDILVYLGRIDLRVASEGSKEAEVREVIVHEDWSTKVDKYDADVAILVLKEAVEFNDFVRAVCITEEPEMLKQFEGTVVSLN